MNKDKELSIIHIIRQNIEEIYNNNQITYGQYDYLLDLIDDLEKEIEKEG